MHFNYCKKYSHLFSAEETLVTVNLVLDPLSVARICFMAVTQLNNRSQRFGLPHFCSHWVRVNGVADFRSYFSSSESQQQWFVTNIKIYFSF